MSVVADDRDYHNGGCVNVALLALLLMPYALIRHGIAQYPGTAGSAVKRPEWEYTQMCCDAWQMHHLANNWHGRYGWETVAVVNLPAGYKVPREAGDEDGPEYEAVCPVAVLFRRQIGCDS